MRRHPGHVTDGGEPVAGAALAPGDAAALGSVFAAPRWLRDLGLTAWFVVGVLAVLAALTWLLGATETIVGPVIAGTIVAAVTSPLVWSLQQHRIPRAAGAAIVLLSLVAVAIGILVLVLAGIKDQSGEIKTQASAAASKAEGWLKSAGVDSSSADEANAEVSSSTSASFKTLTQGIVNGIQGIASLAFAMSFTALALFFLLKDGPTMRAWVDRHLGLPPPVAQTITGGIIRSLRGYFRGVTLVAAFNGVVVTLGALILDVPLAGTIGIVTFITAYVPYIGALVAGAFAVIIALGAKGTTTALIMLVLVLLANGLLQNIVQPFAMGAALHLHPLAVLVLTIGAGCIFGMLGLVLAAPLASAAVHIMGELRDARTAAASAQPERAPPDAPPDTVAATPAPT